MKLKLFHIYYDLETQNKILPGFLPLDNLENQRPDWREYWPIRQWRIRNEFEEDTYYGFFSPKFYDKTNLSYQQVADFIEKNDADIISFSPFLDHSGPFLNIFEHGEISHRGFRTALEGYLDARNLPFSPFSSINDHSKFIFCNFFVAKKFFWDHWFTHAEFIFQSAEENKTELGKTLNASATYKHGIHALMKVFVIERLASFLVNLHPGIRVASYPGDALPFEGNTPLSKYREEILSADKQKTKFLKTGNLEELENFLDQRKKLIQLAVKATRVG